MSAKASTNGSGRKEDALDRLAAEQAPAPLAELLANVEQVISRYVVMNDDQRCALVLWVAHTHAFGAAESTMYMSISSAEKQSGKSRLIETLDLLVARSWMTGKVTSAVLARKIEAEKPTLMLDEIDAAFGGDAEFTETLRGILNTGIRKSGKTTVCVTRGSEISYEDFSTFCPKLFAGIGNRLPDTIQDRSVNVRLTRRTRDEPVQRFRHRDAEASTKTLREQLGEWANEAVPELTNARPDLPDDEALSDRALDGWEPLWAIADLAGGPWPQRARNAAVALATDGADTTVSKGVELLTDLKGIFKRKKADKLASLTIITALNLPEDRPWGAFNQGEGIKPRDLASLLKPYAISPNTVRKGDDTFKGYHRRQFTDAWARFALPPSPEEPSQASQPSQPAPGPERHVTGVTDVTADPGRGPERAARKPNPFKRDNSELPTRRPSKGGSKHGQPPRLKRQPTQRSANHE